MNDCIFCKIIKGEIPSNKVYEDDEIILVRKERGILIHSDGNTNETLLNAVSFYLEKQGLKNKCRVLHRIDLETTGLVLFSKNLLSYYYINKQMEDEKIKKVYIAKNFNDKEIIKFIQDNKISYSVTDPKNMDGMVEGRHQGIIAVIDDYEYVDYRNMLNDNVVVMLDHLEDPHNFGAIIRTCEAAGIKSIIIPKDRSVSVTSTVMKTSAGALEHVNIAMVNNLVNVIDDFKDNGFFVYAADMDGRNYKDVDYANKVLLVIGSEGNGVGRLVKKNCDQILAIPMSGHVNSLNASVAAAILIYGIVNK